MYSLTIFVVSEKAFEHFPIGSNASISCNGGHLEFPISIKNPNFVEDLPMIIPEQFGLNCPSSFREKVL